LAPAAPDNLLTLGTVYYRLGDYDKAVNTLHSAQKSGTSRYNESLSKLLLAMCYQNMRQVETAKQFYQESSQLRSEEIRDILARRDWEAIRAEARTLLGVD
jgi:TolA-binding protein